MSASPSPAPLTYSDEFISGILQRTKSVAVIGASNDPVKASYFVAKYLSENGYRVYPINPKLAGQTLLGQTVYAKLADLPETVDLVDVFRNAAAVGAMTDEIIAHGAKVLWMQLTVRNDDAAARAEAAGLTVVMDRCPKIEYQRLIGEIGRIGINSNVMTSKRRPLAKQTKKLM